MNTLSVTEKETILGLLRLGWSIRHVSRETGRRHETIARYGREAGLLPAKPHTAGGTTGNACTFISNGTITVGESALKLLADSSLSFSTGLEIHSLSVRMGTM